METNGPEPESAWHRTSEFFGPLFPHEFGGGFMRKSVWLFFFSFCCFPGHATTASLIDHIQIWAENCPNGVFAVNCTESIYNLSTVPRITTATIPAISGQWAMSVFGPSYDTVPYPINIFCLFSWDGGSTQRFIDNPGDNSVGLFMALNVSDFNSGDTPVNVSLEITSNGQMVDSGAGSFTLVVPSPEPQSFLLILTGLLSLLAIRTTPCCTRYKAAYSAWRR
jgi:hypothetical protein